MSPAGRRAMAWAGALVALAIVFLAYLKPDFAVTIANQIWACF